MQPHCASQPTKIQKPWQKYNWLKFNNGRVTFTLKHGKCLLSVKCQWAGGEVEIPQECPGFSLPGIGLCNVKRAKCTTLLWQ